MRRIWIALGLRIRESASCNVTPETINTICPQIATERATLETSYEFVNLSRDSQDLIDQSLALRYIHYR